MTGGFFPTPYPDECLYSILCRYYARCGGAGYREISQMLFGGVHNPAATIYLPVNSECIDYWASLESGVTRASIAASHTMYPYFAMTYGLELRTEIERVLNGGVPTPSHNGTLIRKGDRSRLQYLRYCPLCTQEDIAMCGETYWHRKHQFPGSYYCTKHHIRLCNSHISIKQTAWGFYPASTETRAVATDAPADTFDKYRDKCLKIGQESEWLLENGLSVNWHENGAYKYLNFFRDIGMASIRGTRGYYSAIGDAVNDYWGNEFLNALFSETKVLSGWLSRIRINRDMMGRLLPLQHILLICVAKNSVEDFVSSEVVENPFVNIPHLCENPVCERYHVGSAVCTEVRNTSSRVIGFFHCINCGMKYSIAKGKKARGALVVIDYGHLWFNELIRCGEDKGISIPKTAEILKCNVKTIKKQRKKLGLVKTP